jgi:hypothetical protein
MSRIKVIVKGQAGTGHHRVAEAILNALDRAGAHITVESLDKLHAGIGAVYNGLGHKVKLKVVQEPRVEQPKEEPRTFLLQGGEVLMAVSEEEQRYVLTRRGQSITGYNVHQDKDGRFYYWSWGRQPAGELLEQIADLSPMLAADKFLAIYEPCATRNRVSCVQPKRKDCQPIVGETC